MASADTTRTGLAVSASEYPPTPFVFSRKTLPRNNILVGDNEAQLRFFEQYSGITVETAERITDETLLGKEGLALRVYASHRIDLSQDVKAKTGIWSADAITRGSSGANALVKQAALMLGLGKLSRETVDLVSAQVSQDGIEDIRGSLWQAVWILSAEVQPPAKWTDPWKDPVRWMDSSDPAHRLHSLYRSLVGWAYIAVHDSHGVRQFGIRPAHQQFLKTQKLDPRKVVASIRVLSAWKSAISDPFVCALRISSIWA